MNSSQRYAAHLVPTDNESLQAEIELLPETGTVNTGWVVRKGARSRNRE